MLDGDVFFFATIRNKNWEKSAGTPHVSRFLPAKYFLTLTIKLNHYMKKYITLAALLAAGTACANAAKEELTLTSPTDGSLTSSNAAIAWEDAEVTGALQSWEVTFTVASQRSTLADTDLVSICGKWKFAFNADGSIEFYSGVGQSNYSDAGWVSVEPVTITVSFVGDYDMNGVFQDKGELSATIGENTYALKVTDNLAITSGNVDTGFRLWTNNKNEHYSGISVAKLDNHIVPEPSAFGMLAGLGALALVASRRRRK